MITQEPPPADRSSGDHDHAPDDISGKRDRSADRCVLLTVGQEQTKHGDELQADHEADKRGNDESRHEGDGPQVTRVHGDIIAL